MKVIRYTLLSNGKGDELHKIKTDKIERSAYSVKDILPPSIIKKYNKMNFWENNTK